MQFIEDFELLTEKLIVFMLHGSQKQSEGQKSILTEMLYFNRFTVTD